MTNSPANIRVSKRRSKNTGSLNSRRKKNSPLVSVISATEDTRVLFTALLDFWGYRVVELEKTEQFNETFKRRKPDLIIMDLPKFYAVGLVDFCRLRKFTESHDVPVILISGYSQPDYRRAAMELGADGFLVKPIDFDNFEEILKRFLSRQHRPLPESDDLKLDLAPHHFSLSEVKI
jgi:DNA-binding response OmpR family regulator